VSSRFARLIVFFAAVQILGGHWLALQSVAWVGMIAKYAQGDSLTVALEKTFDGAHPCDLCNVVKSGREQEQKSDLAKIIVKLDAVLAGFSGLPLPIAAEWTYGMSAPVIVTRTLAPPTPPPWA
jgi:hypothetical protein